jgi:mannose-6-phosphate isomerase-like protein (cupin superfamily)
MIIRHDTAPRFEQGGTSVIGYASPSRGASDLSLWRISLAPGEASPPHQLSREEIFLALDGAATATLGERQALLAPGDCLVVPPGVRFVLTAGEEGFGAVCAMAAGGTATLEPDGPTIVPPWAA